MLATMLILMRLALGLMCIYTPIPVESTHATLREQYSLEPNRLWSENLYESREMNANAKFYSPCKNQRSKLRFKLGLFLFPDTEDKWTDSANWSIDGGARIAETTI